MTTIKHAQMFDQAAKAFKEFCQTIAQLRDPKDGCPWDLEQTHQSLRQYMIEEAYEAVDAMGEQDPQEICDELGDVLLQVVLNSQISLDDGTFTIADVVHSIDRKMRRRHPHIFSKEKEKYAKDLESLHKQWDLIKKEEKNVSPESLFERAKVSKAHPASLQSLLIGKQASKINFDWGNAHEVFNVLKSEIFELEESWNNGHPKSREHLVEEIGDVYFTLAQFCRHLKLDPEVTAIEGNKKFLRRFKVVEELAKNKGMTIEKASAKELEDLWNEAKTQLKKR